MKIVKFILISTLIFGVLVFSSCKKYKPMPVDFNANNSANNQGITPPPPAAGPSIAQSVLDQLGQMPDYQAPQTPVVNVTKKQVKVKYIQPYQVVEVPMCCGYVGCDPRECEEEDPCGGDENPCPEVYTPPPAPIDTDYVDEGPDYERTNDWKWVIKSVLPKRISDRRCEIGLLRNKHAGQYNELTDSVTAIGKTPVVDCDKMYALRDALLDPNNPLCPALSAQVVNNFNYLSSNEPAKLRANPLEIFVDVTYENDRKNAKLSILNRINKCIP
ncbi:MAG: hypothetical protein ABIA04_11130 [Pseudomonadota bacterium]